jgi:hypothetical protein
MANAFQTAGWSRTTITEVSVVHESRGGNYNHDSIEDVFHSWRKNV